MAMTWDDITVEQYQQLYDAWQKAEDMEQADMIAEMVAIVFYFTPQQVRALSLEDFRVYCDKIAFMEKVPEWQPRTGLKINGRRYRFIYDVRQIRAGRVIEIKYNQKEGIIPKLHTLAASMVVPRERTWYGGWRDAEFKAAQYEDYASDMRQAPITAVYGSALFFSKVWNVWIKTSADFLTQSLPTKERTKAKSLLLDSCSYLDGSTMPDSLQSGNA